MSNEYWILYDPSNKMQTEKLTTEDAQLTLLKMKTKEINNFLIWKTDWEKWQKLRDFLTSDISPFMSTFFGKANATEEESESTASIKMKPVDKEIIKKIKASFSNVSLEELDLSQVTSSSQAQFNADQISAEDKCKSDISFKSLNKKTAFAKTNTKEDQYKIELLLIHPKATMFRTIAKDISLSGTFAEKIIPEEFHQTAFDLVIINNFIADAQHNRLSLKAQIKITDSSIYLEYVSLSEEKKENLRALLDYYIRSSKKIST
jgi:hypothetical protein